MAETLSAKGWRGRPDSLDFEVVDAGEGIRRHRAFGTLFRLSSVGYPGDTVDYFTIWLPDQWCCELRCSVHFVDNKKALSAGFNWPEEAEAYRRKHGYHHYFSWPTVDKGPDATPWTPELVEVLLRAYLIQMDPAGFYFGESPYPDRVDFAPPNLPETLHRSLKNTVPSEVN